MTCGLQLPRLPSPSLSLGVFSDSGLLSRWCNPTLSSFAVSFSTCSRAFPASESFPMSQLFASGGQSMDSFRWTVSDLWSPKKTELWDEGPGLVTQSFCVAEVLLEEASDIDIKREPEHPTPWSHRGLTYFYQTHSHNICLKITRLVTRFLLRKRSMSSSKIHCDYIIISTELKEKQDKLSKISCFAV